MVNEARAERSERSERSSARSCSSCCAGRSEPCLGIEPKTPGWLVQDPGKGACVAAFFQLKVHGPKLETEVVQPSFPICGRGDCAA